MRSILKPKCHALLFDPGFNSEETRYLNAYEILAIGAMKFHSMISDLLEHNSSFLANVIQDTIMYCHWLIQDRCSKFGVDSRIKKPEIDYIGARAFHSILSRKQSRYKDILHTLETNAKKYERIRGGKFSVLKDIMSRKNIDVEIPVLKRIKF